jgi:hypothetical protein
MKLQLKNIEIQVGGIVLKAETGELDMTDRADSMKGKIEMAESDVDAAKKLLQRIKTKPVFVTATPDMDEVYRQLEKLRLKKEKAKGKAKDKNQGRKEKIKVCKKCGMKFEATSNSQKFCSEECGMKPNPSYKKTEPTPAPTANKTFIPSRDVDPKTGKLRSDFD